ncbi:MAG: CRISPR-associated endoribonuclease Cas6 [Candidatus Methanomethylicaceae archaeon]
MRLRIRFSEVDGKPVLLPCHYNELIQGLIYRNLNSFLAQKIHDHGFVDPETKRKLKLFTFSRLIPEKKAILEKGNLKLFGDINLIVSSPIVDFIESFASNLLKKQCFQLGTNNFFVVSVEVLSPPGYQARIKVRTLSPITVYSTLRTVDGRKKTYYYSPWEKEFVTIVIENLKKKLRSLSGIEAQGGAIKPVSVRPTDEKIIVYKNTVIKGWDGVFELCLPPELFDIAFDCGLGSKNSQGFGCIEAYCPKIKKDDS